MCSVPSIFVQIHGLGEGGRVKGITINCTNWAFVFGQLNLHESGIGSILLLSDGTIPSVTTSSIQEALGHMGVLSSPPALFVYVSLVRCNRPDLEKDCQPSINYSTRYGCHCRCYAAAAAATTVHLHWGMSFIHVYPAEKGVGWQWGKGLHIYYN